jgi:choline dehydrogenase-like flavoprotein
MVVSSSLGNTGGVPVTLESLLVDQYLSANYNIRITETATRDTTVFDAVASHNGDTSNDADGQNLISRRLRGMGAVGGAAVDVNLSGAAGAQVLNVTAVAAADFDVFVSRYAYTLAP